MKKRKTKKRLPFIAWLGASFIIFVAVVNTIPSLVTSTTNIPVVGKIVKAVNFDDFMMNKNEDLQEEVNIESVNFTQYGNPVQELSFNEGIATGGEITDNINVNSISILNENNAEHIVIGFALRDENKPLLAAPYFEIEYDENPYTMTFSIYGARAFDANDFKNLKKSDFIMDAYELFTPDDSLIRFVIVFKGPVFIEGKEYADPANIIVTVFEDMHVKDVKQYAIRTAPYLFGGEIAILEEYLHEEEGIRILRESGILFSTWESEFYIEAGMFNKREEAEKKASEINEKFGSDIQVYVEER
ncbi:hypothetical protein MHZ92_14730 [Sporosarcina sp. ACRSL]|uniref:hypothetical protein n=1 Tax=Sporosarcina sp. ACRSL TaxID=2918215 RepID=UPI001EF72BAC|nr:hypothetical protein [Sporosarcina sp. ACRSL]MCG7345390.1 hypothetical protein [Sporosarcina sp. ACRSL]